MYSFFRVLIIQKSIRMYTRSQSKQFSNYALIHNKSSQEFHMKFNSDTAFVQYVKDGDILDLTESFVPDSLRGKGLGHKLAKSTFDYIDQNNLKMKITCEFLHKVYEENKNTYKHLVVE